MELIFEQLKVHGLDANVDLVAHLLGLFGEFRGQEKVLREAMERAIIY